jgi:hypothetical protein
MFSSTEASTSQWESNVFVSPIKAPALMILDEYGVKGWALSGSTVLAGMILLEPLNAPCVFLRRPLRSRNVFGQPERA